MHAKRNRNGQIIDLFHLEILLRNGYKDTILDNEQIRNVVAKLSKIRYDKWRTLICVVP